ncbi:MAG: IS3 family transposase [Rhodobacteraceae bacterium]|nr:IS3 family transposase [Paracoccaceae bacterium]
MVTDMTFIPTRQGWLYLAIVLDLFSRAVVGWSMSRRMKSELVVDALSMAVMRRNPNAPVLVHSDQGSQYGSEEYQCVLREQGMICSMSRKGHCWDNAVAESFFHTLKTELIHHESYHTRIQAQESVFKYIEIFYNRKRRHSHLNYQAPMVFEMNNRNP